MYYNITLENGMQHRLSQDIYCEIQKHLLKSWSEEDAPSREPEGYLTTINNIKQEECVKRDRLLDENTLMELGHSLYTIV